MRVRSVVAVAGLAACSLFMAAPAAAGYLLTTDIYIVGSNPPGNALDPVGNPIGGVSVISWIFDAPVAGHAKLSIRAEGVDGGPDAPGAGERDEVFVNGASVGFLVDQGFYSPLFNLNPGPGALPRITGLTDSFFDVFVTLGPNQIEVHVDPGNWINEIETSALAPAPGTLALFGLALGGLGFARRRRT